MSGLIFHPYAPRDLDACLDIFRSNTPRFFRLEELDEFRQFLENPQGAYLVAVQNNEVVACGGYAYHDGKQAVVLTWGMVRADLHKHGLGKFLLTERLRQIYIDFSETIVKIDTSQYSQGFFEKQGFKTDKIAEDFFAPGLHKVEMELYLNRGNYRTLLSEANS